MFLLKIIIILIYFASHTNAAYFKSVFNLTEYYSMPPQYYGDDYTRCMIEGETALWCATYSIIKPNESNPTWNLIQKYSNDKKRQFRHDLLHRGLCINWCLDKLRKFDNNETLASMFVEPFDFGDQYTVDFSIYYNSTYFKEKYDYYVSICNSLDLFEKYGLDAHGGIIYCYSPLEDKSPDGLDYAFIIVVSIIVLILTAATILDICLKDTGDKNHFESPITDFSLPIRLMLAFSIPRNWYRLYAKPKSPDARTFRYIQGLRSTTTFMVVLGHVYFSSSICPISNTEFIEETYYHLSDTLVLTGMNIVQTFFAISGFLMGMQFFELTKDKKFNFNYFWVAIIYRYIRLTPIYAMIIFFEATWQYKLGESPFWKRISGGEMTYCRRNWWTNLLYINNYVNSRQMCLIQSWYLSADFQLFIIGLLVVMGMWKYPKYRNGILYVCLIVSYVIPGIVAYVRKIDGVFYLTPHERKFIYDSQSEGFFSFYIPTHTNAGNYFAGLAIAMFYLHLKRNRIDISKYKSFTFIFYAVFPLGLLSWLSSYLFYTHNFEKPSIALAAYAALSKNVWGILGAVMSFGFLAGIGGIIRRIFYLPVFQSLGRLTYCIYLVHMCVLRFLNGGNTMLPNISMNMMIQVTVAAFFISIFVSIALCITLEFPFTALLKEFVGNRQRAEMRQKEDDVELTNNNVSKEP